MQKLILTSLLIATFAIPTVLHRKSRASDGYRSMVPPFAAFVAVYVLLLLYVYPRFS